MSRTDAINGVLRPEDLYRWPDGVQARLGVGRCIYDLVRIGGLRVRAFGRRRYVRGNEVIEALGRITGGDTDDSGDHLLRTVDTQADYEIETSPAEPAQERQADASAGAAAGVASQGGAGIGSVG